jgi:hypothetical protein
VVVNLFAQIMKNEQIGSGNIQNNNYIEKLIKQITNNNNTYYYYDTLFLQTLIREEVKSLMDTVIKSISDMELKRNQYAQKEKVNKDSINRLNEKIKVYKDALSLLTEREQKLQVRKYNYLPLGVHQFSAKQTGKGILFLVTEAGLIGTGIGYCISSKANLKKHKDTKYEYWERDRFYDKYKRQLKTSGWLFASAGLMTILNYCDNFNWFRKNTKDISVSIVPASVFNLLYQPQMAITLHITF